MQHEKTPETPVEGTKDWSYAHERLLPLGWTEERNQVVMPRHVSGDNKEHRYPLFDADDKGNLVIPYYRITGAKAEYRKDGAKWGKHYQVLRLRAPITTPEGEVMKYKIPKGAGTFPWFPPALIDHYNAGKEIETLVLTEGALKAYAGSVHGLHIVGLTSITHYQDKATNTLHADVIEVLKRCKPKQVIWLVDGDCRNLSSKWPELDPSVDLYRRPNQFFSSARNVGELLKDYARMVGFRPYFMHLVSDAVSMPPGTEQPKGLDDLLLAYPEAKVHAAGTRHTPDSPLVLPTPEERERLRAVAITEVVADLQDFSRPPRFFERRDLDRPEKLREYFHLRSAESFYTAYADRIGEREFVYDGTKYQWDPNDKALKVLVPSVAKKYVRVGTDYFKYVKVRNPHSNKLEEFLKPWSRSTIIEDHGKHFTGHVLKLETFTNYPDHIAYQEIKDNCLNSYSRFMHTPDPDADAPETTLKFLAHIFGKGVIRVENPKQLNPDGTPQVIQVSELDLGLDYLKLLYEKPTQMLPILCLVSKARETGKTTFFDYLQNLFSSNCTFISAKDLESDFNAHYASKLIIIIDEALISKQESVEKLKSLSTAKNIQVNNKGIAQYPQPFFGKILMGSNNIRNFIRTDDDETRFWVRNVPAIATADRDINLMDKLVDEIPAFLHYLVRRPMATEALSRAWFYPPLLVTEALREVRKHSVSTVQRTITGWIRGIFWAKRDLERILMTAGDIKREMFMGNSRVDEVYIKQVLREDLRLERYKNAEGKQATTPYSYWRIIEKRDNGTPETDLQEVKIRVSNRPFVFHRRDFISEQEELEVMRELQAPEQLEKAGQEKLAMATASDDDDLPF